MKKRANILAKIDKTSYRELSSSVSNNKDHIQKTLKYWELNHDGPLDCFIQIFIHLSFNHYLARNISKLSLRKCLQHVKNEEEQ